MSFISDFLPDVDILIQGDNSSLPLGFDLLDHEPFLQVSLSPVEMGLLFWSEALLLKLLPDLAPACPFGEAFQDLHNSEVNSSGLAGGIGHVCHSETAQHRVNQITLEVQCLRGVVSRPET